MAKQIVINGDKVGVGWTKANDNFTELYDEAVAMSSYASLYLSSPEPLTITPGTPLSVTTATVVRANNFAIVGGSLVYMGEDDVIVKVDGAISVTSGTNNVVLTVSFAKNEILDNTEEIASRISRKIGTGADVGAIPLAGTYELTTGDKLDFYADVDTLSTITIVQGNFTIHTLAVL